MACGGCAKRRAAAAAKATNQKVRARTTAGSSRTFSRVVDATSWVARRGGGQVTDEDGTTTQVAAA